MRSAVTSPPRGSDMSARVCYTGDRQSSVIAAVDAASLTAAVGIPQTRIERRVRPVSLDLPERVVPERQERRAERPGALVRVLLAVGVVPRVQVRIRHHLGQFVTA